MTMAPSPTIWQRRCRAAWCRAPGPGGPHGVQLRERVGHDPTMAMVQPTHVGQEVVGDVDRSLDPGSGWCPPWRTAWSATSTTPDHTRNPASVVTNDGNPEFGDDQAWSNPIAVVTGTAPRMHAHQGQPGSPGRRSSVMTTPPIAATNATERSIEPRRRSGERTRYRWRIVATGDICRSRLVKFRAVRNCLRGCRR